MLYRNWYKYVRKHSIADARMYILKNLHINYTIAHKIDMHYKATNNYVKSVNKHAKHNLEDQQVI